MSSSRIYSPESLSCFNQLKRDILCGVYFPGEKLTLSKLKNLQKWGQSPLREALSRLLAKELVEFEENKGYRVAKISEVELRDLFRAISQIEPLVIKQSLQDGNDPWEVNLVALFHQVALFAAKTEPIDYFSWVDCDFLFHRQLILGGSSSALIKIHEVLFLKLERYLKLGLKFNRELIEKSLQGKKNIFEAALRRDWEETSRIFITDLSAHLEEIIKRLKSKEYF